MIDSYYLMYIILDMPPPESKIAQLRVLAGQVPFVRTRDLVQLCIPPRYLGRLCTEGVLVKSGHGLYRTTVIDPETLHAGLAQATREIPNGVICLLSALRFHEIGTQSPHQVWMALDRRAARPRARRPHIRLLRFSGPALTEGVEEHDVAGTRVRIYGPAKTVADCFKYRNKIGLDVALEALREALRGRRCTADELWRYAAVCRVANIMRPYMEAML